MVPLIVTEDSLSLSEKPKLPVPTISSSWLVLMPSSQVSSEIRLLTSCLLYTSDAADEGLGVDLGGRRIIKKKIKEGSVEVVGVFVF